MCVCECEGVCVYVCIIGRVSFVWAILSFMDASEESGVHHNDFLIKEPRIQEMCIQEMPRSNPVIWCSVVLSSEKQV